MSTSTACSHSTCVPLETDGKAKLYTIYTYIYSQRKIIEILYMSAILYDPLNRNNKQASKCSASKSFQKRGHCSVLEEHHTPTEII